jgi:site-specific DNA recombinase
MNAKNAVIYTRVSTEEQEKNGYSLLSQEDQLRKYCSERNISVLKHFQDHHSAKTFNRPQYNKLLEFITTHKKNIQYLLVTRWDRFSRAGIVPNFQMIDKFTRFGIEIVAIQEPQTYDTDEIPETLIPQVLAQLLPHIENMRIAKRTRDGMRKALKLGCWAGHAPVGYDNYRDERGKNNKNERSPATLIPNEKAAFVQQAFSEYAKGIFSAEEVRKKLFKKGLKLTKQAFLNMLRNPVYCGKILVRAWKDEEEEIVDGLHSGLITESVFEQVQNIFSGKKKIQIKTSKRNEKLFLRGYLTCPVCKRTLTGSESKGNGGKYYYYHCNCNYCRIRFRADKANLEFTEYLTSFRPRKEIIELYYEVLRNIATEKAVEKHKTLKALEKELLLAKTRIVKIEDDYSDGIIDGGSFNHLKGRYSERIVELTNQINEVENQETSFEKHIKFGVSLLTNLSEYFIKAPIELKHKMIGLFFPEKLFYEKGNYRTTKMNQVLDLIYLLSSEMDKGKMKQASISAGLSTQAPQTGLEPVTL